MRMDTLPLSTGEKVERFWREHAAWSQETFGTDQERGPIGPLKHLAKEAVEAQADITDRSEFADCLILTFDAARRAGMTLDDLINAANAKLEKNRNRVWAKPTNSEEPIEHVRGIYD
jgi:ParB family chromosome partitioning protein